MDVTADDPVGTAPARLSGESLLERSDEIDRVLYLQLGPLGKRPIGQPECSAYRVEMGVEPDRKIIGFVAQQREPAGVTDDDIEKVAVNHKVMLAVGRNMDGILNHFDATQMRAVIIPQEFVMISWNVDKTCAFARLAQKFLHDVVVSLRPEPARFQLPSIDDVADEVD